MSLLEQQAGVISTELALSNILDDRGRVKNKLQLISTSSPCTKSKRYTVSNPNTIQLSNQLPRVNGYSTQLSYNSTSKINPFKMMEFQNNNGGKVKVKSHTTNYLENKIKPIKSPKKQSRQISNNQKLDLPRRQSLPHKQKSSILDKNNLYLVSFLKNKIKRITKLIEKSEDGQQYRDKYKSKNQWNGNGSHQNTNGIAMGSHFPSDIEMGTMEYNYKTISKRSHSVISSGKRYSRIRSSKGNAFEMFK